MPGRVGGTDADTSISLVQSRNVTSTYRLCQPKMPKMDKEERMLRMVTLSILGETECRLSCGEDSERCSPPPGVFGMMVCCAHCPYLNHPEENRCIHTPESGNVKDCSYYIQVFPDE
jgi:hypothetical protein